MPVPPTPDNKVAVLMDGSLHRAIIAAAMSELYGNDCVAAILCPHLSVDNPEGVYSVCRRYCSEIKTIPVTMMVADLINELNHAEIEIKSSRLIQQFIDSAREMVWMALKAHGYLWTPSIAWDKFDEHGVNMATQLGIPVKLFTT